MAVLVSAFKIAKSFGAQNLFRDLTFSIETGQKIGLIGPNGAGKSTLLQILAKAVSNDNGQLSFANNLRLGYLEQNPKFKPNDTVYSALVDACDDPYDYENLGLIQELISKLDLENIEAGTDRLADDLSGGWRKRLALARELVKKPNLLLLDEPTNHLDLPSILWLEEFIERQRELALLIVTHDRLFLQNTCDMIFDLDRRNPEGLIKFVGTYAEFSEHKEATLDAQKHLESARKNLLRHETAWLRRGAKARQTKQKARIERAGDLSAEVDILKERNQFKKINVDFGEVEKGPKKMIEAKNISKSFGDRTIYKNFSIQITPKSRIGLLGRNGCGKSTLIRALIGQEKPDSGEVNMAEQIKVAYFEQQKESLNPALSALKTICPEGDTLLIKGQSVFARSYLARFQFRGDQMDLPVGKLSGGEQSRLLIARLMLQNEPVLVLDEPTNDLDIATLDVLQDALAQFQGAVILVTHDRYFMDQVTNQILAFTENNGEILKFADFFQWEAWAQKQPKPAKSSPPPSAVPAATATPQKIRLSQKEQRELEQMESKIHEAESFVLKIQNELIAPENLNNYSKMQELGNSLATRQLEVEKLYARWEELNKKKS